MTGSGSTARVQQDVASVLLSPFRWHMKSHSKVQKKILSDFNGTVKSGEMLLVRVNTLGAL